uniref:Uncharacterized protein n=1 Tax=Meloidogyne incognita TaxID=6306 RepID=A0A914L2F2_MELIC
MYHNNLTQLNEAEINPIVFHEWLLNKDEDRIPFLHIEELNQYEEWKANEKTEEHHRALSLGAIPNGIKGVAAEIFRGIFETIVQHWITACCVYTTFLFVRDVFIPIGLAYLILPTIRSFCILIRTPRTRTTQSPDEPPGIEMGETLSLRRHSTSGSTSNTPVPGRSSIRKSSSVHFNKAGSTISLNSGESPFGNPLKRLNLGLN